MMNWLKSFASTPFSDLWLPTLLIGMGLIAALGLHWLWLQWRLSQLEAQSRAVVLNAAAQADADSRVHNLAKQDSISNAYAQTSSLNPNTLASELNALNGLSDIHAFTAQKSPVLIEDFDSASALSLSEQYATAPDATGAVVHDVLNPSQRVEPSFTFHDAPSAIGNKVTSDTSDTYKTDGKHLAPDNKKPDDNGLVDDNIFFNPHNALIEAKKQQQTPFIPHPQLHYQIRFTWSDGLGKQVMNDVLLAHPWPHPLPVVWVADPHDSNSLIAAWQVLNRRELATAEQAKDFVQWCGTLASLGGAKFNLIESAPWEAFLDEAHSLLIGLDSVIVLKVSVPLVQLDLFAQSLLAARFTQSQEHWVYQDHASSSTICLERLWQQPHAAQPKMAEQAAEHVFAEAPQNATFQLIIDIPHLDSLEARKVYMRLRAVARASAAILQSGQGAHLSEGMLDRYSRELLLKQEALSTAHIAPGSTVAKQVFSPNLRMNSDLAF